MNINYLKKEMLQHEFTIRGIPHNGTKTVGSVRSALCSILALEKYDASLSYPPYTLDVDEEM